MSLSALFSTTTRSDTVIDIAAVFSLYSQQLTDHFCQCILPERTPRPDTRFCSPFSIFPELLKSMYPHNHLLSHQPWPAPERQLARRSGIQHRHADHSQRGTGTTGDRVGQELTVKEKIPARRPGSFTVNKNRDQPDLQLSRFQGSVYRPFHPVQEDRPATLLLSKPNDECFL